MLTGSFTKLLKLRRRPERRRTGCKFAKKRDDWVWRRSIGLEGSVGDCGFALGVELLIFASC